MLSIGDLSRRTGVKVPTIRYYEQLGLIGPEGRTDGNQRRYSRDGLDRLAFIRHARDLGLPLEAIREMIGLHGAAACDSAHRIAADHLAEVRRRIAALHRLEAELTRIAQSCNGTGGACRILGAFADHGQCGGDHKAA
ncbi:MAG: helix-turn-helix domain-containing protein [Proteobacteria bacterium]|nr:helix-turn-helix domain-containing protein [Pseudomonadota bacterium]MBS0574576.1 helix-turn-helix domain-containing protein [Pseudomonadota bacterium]